MTRPLIIALLLAVVLAPLTARAADEPRVVAVLYDGSYAGSSAAIAAPALAHLGLLVEPHDAAAPLPDLSGRADLRGVVIWLDKGDLADAANLVTWMRNASQSGLPVVLMGATPEVEDRFGLFLAIGLLYARDDRAYTYDLKPVDRDIDLTDYERPYDNIFAPVPIVRALDGPLSHAVLTLQRRADAIERTSPVIITAKGAYAADGYALWRDASRTEHRWYIDPVGFFRLALKMEGVPAPDRTTLTARRIFAASIVSNDDAPGSWYGAAVETATRHVAGRLDELPIDVSAALAQPSALSYPIPKAANRCDDPVRARLLGYDGAAAALADAAVSRRLTPFAPLFSVCARSAPFLPFALDTVLEAAERESLAPVSRDTLTDIEASFAGVRLEQRGPMAWRVLDRGAIQTLRFDDANDLRIDWARSAGVLGAGRVGASLYVSLDPAVSDPSVALTEAAWSDPPFPALVESRWSVAALDRDARRAAMDVVGFGPGDMGWSVTPNTSWEIRLTPSGRPTYRYRGVATPEGLLSFSLPPLAAQGAGLELVRRDDDEGTP